MFVLDLPLALLVLWLFHRYAKEPLWEWMPRSFRERVRLGPRALQVKTAGRSALVAISILVGEATHIIWDSFTHRSFWPYRHLRFLHWRLALPLGSIACYQLLQYASSIIGSLVILIWFLRLPRNAYAILPEQKQNSRASELTVFVLASAALAAGLVRACLGVGVPDSAARVEEFVVQALLAVISVFWLELVVYGIVRDRSARRQMQTA
jgi:hypothetical protein